MDKNSITEMEELEDGEIGCDDGFDEIYTPLERPTCNAPVAKTVAESDGDDKDPSSEDSDSSDGGGNGPKIKRKPRSSAKLQEQKPKKNLKIWCNVLQAESVSTVLTDCNLDMFQRKIRGLEPYSWDSERGSRDGQYIGPGKRNHGGNFVSDNKFVKQNNFNEKRGAPKIIEPLSETTWDSDEKLAKEIAKKLSEVKDDLILRAIQIAGKEKILMLFEETRNVEKDGGMLIMNGSRRRTSGGVFFNLLKTADDIPQIQLKEIFHLDKQDATAQKRKVQRQIRKQMATKVKDDHVKEVEMKVT
ncbi:UNVERIFIED_CONTAM: hypothetical protein PYX00_000466 [Menopon gallinae]|uniref:Phosphorylated adapter RNA export protein n=1 Tax=Menopon gallinae TaxID=328185 RepID=A0AAW2I8N8_9NEOP